VDREWVKPVLAVRDAGLRVQVCLVAPERIDEATKTGLHAVLGDLLLAGVPHAVCTADLPISELFHERVSASA
jgi:hypothetical protein